MQQLAYPGVAQRTLTWLMESQAAALEQGARILAAAIERGAVVQAFGTGHSRAVTLEFCSRAGGLAPMSMLAVKDLVMFGGAAPELIIDPTSEREPGLAARIYDLASPGPQDAFVIVSNSGINPAIVEMAQLARGHGHPIVAITSFRHNEKVPSRDASGAHLRDYADVVIDNGAPAGDAAVTLAEDVTVGGLSNLAGVFIAQVLVEAVARILIEHGRPVPVFVSANVPEGDERNRELIARFADRVRPIEP
jgi:uncharacterized phosphosugar-binding protein